MRCEGSGSDEFFHLGVAAPPRSKAGVGNQGFKSFQRGFSPSAGNVGSSFILDIICKSWMLFANSEYFSLSGAGQSKSRHLFLGKIPAKKDLWGLELPRAPSRHVYPAVDVTWRKSWWIFMDLISPQVSPHPFTPGPWKIKSSSCVFPWETTVVGSGTNPTPGTPQIP